LGALVTESGETGRAARNPVGTVLGWVAGALALLIVNFASYQAVGEGYPVELTSFAAVVAGGFGGMAVADRLGPRATRVLGAVVGVLLAVVVVALFLILGASER
jgi:hypothetical protein